MRRFDPTRRAAGWAALGTLCLIGAVGCQTSSQMAKTTEEEVPHEQRAVKPMEPATTASEADLETVYFALDEWTLDEEARAALQKNAKLIEAHPQWGKIRVEGHCDERGSEEYNLVLGKRRAQEVAKYLENLGVPAERITTVSFGEARPAVAGASEEAWKWNRRSVFLQAENVAATPPEPSAEWAAAR